MREACFISIDNFIVENRTSAPKKSKLFHQSRPVFKGEAVL